MSDWQPIDTAPKEPLEAWDECGPTILLSGGYFRNGEPVVRTGYWKAKRTKAWCDSAMGRAFPCKPTHWMPLPEPPPP